MSDHDERSPFEQRSKALFDESVEQLNGHVRSRLTQARHQAVAQSGASHLSRRIWMPAAAATAAAVVAVFVVVPRLGNERGLPESFAAADDMAILLNNDDLELLEDMDFYVWLDSDAEVPEMQSPADNDAHT
ncbi:MAG TPA: hypothetical protein VKB34_09125 [Povalibacter sp.]|nr:hypothetical protein [Povalibacter sp.]